MHATSAINSELILLIAVTHKAWLLSRFWPESKLEFSIIWYNFYTMPTWECIAVIPILHLTRQMDWPPQLHWLPVGCARLPWWSFRIGSMMSIWRDAVPMLLLAPGLLNQSHMLGALSSLCCCGPTALQLSNLQFPTFPPSLPHPGRTKSFNYSINSASFIQQTALDLPNQGHRALSWFTIQSNLHPPYEVQLLLFLCCILTYPSFYFTLTALKTVSLKTSTSSLPPVRLKTLNMTGTWMTSLRNAYRSWQWCASAKRTNHPLSMMRGWCSRGKLCGFIVGGGVVAVFIVKLTRLKSPSSHPSSLRLPTF